MFAQSKPSPRMIGVIRQLKARHHLKIVIVSNKGRELNDHQINQYQLDGFADVFICSCFVHLRKPDKEIFTMALDIAQVKSSQVFYIENTSTFIQIAEELVIRGQSHTDSASTRAQLVTLEFNCADFSKESS